MATMTFDRADLAHAAGVAGLGLLAGLAGALLMSASQAAEMAVTDREASATPTEAVEGATGIDLPEGEEKALSTPIHLAFGAALGLGLAGMKAVSEPARTGLFFAGAWTVGNALATTLAGTEPPTRWSTRELVADLGHHLVYAGGAGAAFAALERLTRD